MKKILSVILIVVLSVLASIGSVYLLLVTKVISIAPVIYETASYKFDILEYDAGGLFEEDTITVSNTQIASVFVIHETGNLGALDLDWFEYDDNLMITFKKSINDNYDRFEIQGVFYNVYSLTDTYIYVDEQLIEYFSYSFVDIPTLPEQELCIEELYCVDYDIFFTEFDEEGILGQYNIMQDTISILNTIPDFMFSTTYAHELEHSRGNLNERRTQFNSFINLWESDIPYLKYMVWLQVSYTIDDFYSYEYDCTDMLFEYVLINKEN